MILLIHQLTGLNLILEKRLIENALVHEKLKGRIWERAKVLPATTTIHKISQ